MRIAVICNDTRGGIQPYVALALGLRSAGHDVRAIAPGDLSPMFSNAGLPATALTGRVEDAVRESKDTAERGSLASIRLAARELPRRLGTWTRETLAACDGVDALTGGIGGMVMGLSVAEKLGRPFIETQLQPIGAPTSEYPGVVLSGFPRPLWRLSHHLSEAALWLPFRGAMRAARKQLGLDGTAPSRAHLPVLYGFSRHVVPLPTTEAPRRFATGYWLLPAPEGWSPPPALERFLSQGPAVAIGFGSMMSGDPAALTGLVLDAVKRAGVRAVLVAGWGGLTQAPARDDVFFADTVPYTWLFPRVAGIVHHGGAGTTGTALWSGTPSLVVPFMMDQPFWGSRVVALGAGPSPIPRPKLTAERLEEALRVMVTDQTMRERAAALGAKLREEDGVAEAVKHFDPATWRP